MNNKIKISDHQKRLVDSIENGTYEQVINEITNELNQGTQMSKIPLIFANKSNNPDPEYAKTGDSGFDIRANLENDVILKPLERALIPTGLFFELPMNMEIQIRSRSGNSFKHGIMVLNSPGTVDCVTEDTMITTINGEKSIKEIYENNIRDIISFNEELFSVEEDIILDMWVVKDKECLEIDVNGSTIIVPMEIELYTKNGWKKANDLDESDEILTLI